ncbi:MAG: cadherin-like beta sandwich domain-containing protein [Clostridia bacterium]|nr:cadherin-like beta sandwich domain-containing protein [Clostridia bacterium]
MRKIINKIYILIISIVFIININSIDTEAAAFTGTCSKTTVELEDTFTIKVNGNGLTGRFNISASSNVTLSTDKVWLRRGEPDRTITATAKATGTATITITAADVTNSDKNEVTGTTKCTVTITEKKANTGGNTSNAGNTGNTGNTTAKSNDATLKSLTVSGGSLNKKFSANTLNYSMTVENNIDSINVKATPNNSKAKATVTGNKNLKAGSNKVKITVTAEDGTKKVYQITVNKLADESGIVSNAGTEEQEVSLKSLTINGVELNTPFKPELYQYECTITEDIEELEIQAIANIETASVEINGNKNLIIGENIITILVKSESGNKTATYQIKVIKQANEQTVEAISNVDESTLQEEITPLWNTTQKIWITILTSIITIMGITFAIIEYRYGKKQKELGTIGTEDISGIEYRYGKLGFEEKNESFIKTKENKEQEEMIQGSTQQLDKNSFIQEKDKKSKGRHF